MDTVTQASRQTKYCKAIVAELAVKKHATNAELHKSLEVLFPGVSATTIHRATARLASRGDIGIAPPALDGSVRYDSNTEQHDHFLCATCGQLKDAHIRSYIAPLLQSVLHDCAASGPITVSGSCNSCIKEG